ncbi:MAG: hypothetical protein QOD39_2512 [Mycobacterium sp.]|jgi:hypothetical protein|nr:hypothetical protein [Mycobacterium sp.]
MAQRVAVSIDVGAGAPIEVIRQLVDDLDTVCQFGGALQYRASVADAQRIVLRNPDRWLDGRDWRRYLRDAPDYYEKRYSEIAPDSRVLAYELVETAVSRYLAENNPTSDTITTVESIRYSNPFDIVLGAAMIVATVVLPTIRDWQARRRVNDAIATDVENTVLARKLLRDELVRRMIEGDLPLSAGQIDDLLTLDVTRAMQALGNAHPNLRELESGDQDDVPEPDVEP